MRTLPKKIRKEKEGLSNYPCDWEIGQFDVRKKFHG
jgi:hypothetical protein